MNKSDLNIMKIENLVNIRNLVNNKWSLIQRKRKSKNIINNFGSNIVVILTINF